MKPFPVILPLWSALAVTACVQTPLTRNQAEHRAAAQFLKAAEDKSTPADQRAALYLNAAAETRSGVSDSTDRLIYNQAAAGLTVLLRSADQGRLWNHPLTLTSGTASYRLHFTKGTRDGVWDPAFFTAFTPAEQVPVKTVQRRNRQDGTGGALVGVHKPVPLERFSPLVGVTAPVTTVVDFKGRDATLTLVDPSEKSKTRVAGAERLLEADFSAPLAYYPHKSEFWNGLMGAIRVNSYMDTTGLYMLRPYDPDRIPLIFVHGLISTPRMWRNVINELETDPVLRERYQCLVFAYPTGNPPAYSALRFREDLALFYQLHPQARPCVLVGHSMGGIVSRMQVTTIHRASWDVIGKNKARQLFAGIEKGSLVARATLFEASPHVSRGVFICTPHRGSQLALGTLGNIARHLIFLPATLTNTLTSSLGNSIAIITGDPKRMPTSVDGLSPTNPLFKVLETTPITVPYHTIAGDQGKGNAPNSSDGVVAYWSSHLKSAKSECIVPGPHGACELPETLAELRRILHLHLQDNSHHR